MTDEKQRIELADDVRTHYEYLVKLGPLKRGSAEWDAREHVRRALGAKCIGFGPIKKHGNALDIGPGYR